MTIEYFLTKVVEGYLFNDLESMSSIKLPEGKESGAVGYPIVSSVMSGVELLGFLISNEKFNRHKSDKYFYEYWNKCLAKVVDEYRNMGELFRYLVRHGLAHTFVTKHGIEIVKIQNGTKGIIEIDTKKRRVVIDCIGLYKDFVMSYNEEIKPILSGRSSLTTTIRMQNQLNSLIEEYQANSEVAFEMFLGNMPPDITYISNVKISGASTGFDEITGYKVVSMSVPASGISPEVTQSGIKKFISKSYKTKDSKKR